MRKKILGLLVLAIIIGGGVLAWILTSPIPPADAPASAGGMALDIPAPDSAHFLQTDPRWGDDTIGGFGGKIRGYGCTMCSVAMAANVLGCDITPKELNARLIEMDGYTARGWLIWSAVQPATDGAVTVHVSSKPSHEAIDRALQAGHVPIIKFALRRGFMHWVPIVGKDGTEYLVRDPLDAEKRVRPLSGLTPAILSLRTVRPAPNAPAARR